MHFICKNAKRDGPEAVTSFVYSRTILVFGPISEGTLCRLIFAANEPLPARIAGPQSRIVCSTHALINRSNMAARWLKASKIP